MLAIRFLAVLVTLGIALLILNKSKNANFEPYANVRLSLWIGGFSFGYTLLWLMVGDAFFDNIGQKVLVGFITGLLWAFQLASLIEAAHNPKGKDEM